MRRYKQQGMVAIKLWIIIITFTVTCVEAKTDGSVTYDNFTRIKVNSQIYWLGNKETSYDTAKMQCADIEADLTLFDTNNEYFAVSQYLDAYVQENNLSLDGIWIELIATDVNKDGLYEHSWRNESFTAGVWHRDDNPIEDEPNSSCNKTHQPCCARIFWLRKKFNDLRDIPCMGFRFNPLCKPRDECSDGTAECDQVCVEKVRGYDCACEEGYTLQPDGRTCVDSDECKSSPSLCQQICTNTIGSFTCSCDTGYNLSPDGYSCDDVDECFEQRKCQHNCTNTEGSYLCSCYNGYTLSADRYSCQDVDECKEQQHQCSGACINTIGGYSCGCPDGYTLSANRTSCQDVDECQNVGALCQHECRNIPGSFSCTCHIGFVLGKDQSSCVEQTTSDMCPCSCRALRMLQASRLSSQNNADNIEGSLLLDKTTLSSYRRTKSSANDQRPFIQAIGYSGVLLMTIVLGWVIVPDVLRAVRFFVTRCSQSKM